MKFYSERFEAARSIKSNGLLSDDDLIIFLKIIWMNTEVFNNCG